MLRKDRYQYVLDYFRQEMPRVTTELEFGSAFQLLVATLLSAQCTDKRVNMVTPALFERYPNAASMALASEQDLFELIKSISYPNAKSKNLLKMARRLNDVYKGEVPQERKDLESLAGVGRKTANVILAVLFDQNVMPVDTHVHRVSRRIGLSKNAKTPAETEKQLMEVLSERNDIALLHHQLILLGRYVCKARKPLCESCPLTDCCKFYLSKLSKQKAV